MRIASFAAGGLARVLKTLIAQDDLMRSTTREI
jgi:hypothetical protein